MRPSKLTPKKRERYLALRAQGKGLREAAAEVGVHHSTVARWEAKDAGAKAVVGEAPKRPAKRGPTQRPALAPVPSSPDADLATTLVAEALPRADDPEALAVARRRLVLIDGLLSRLMPYVQAAEYPATNYVTIARYGDDLTRLIAELTPPTPKDPAEDEKVKEAARTLSVRFERMIAAAEEQQKQTGKCWACGQATHGHG